MAAFIQDKKGLVWLDEYYFWVGCAKLLKAIIHDQCCHLGLVETKYAQIVLLFFVIGCGLETQVFI